MVKEVRAIIKLGGSRVIPIPSSIFKDENKLIIELVSYKEDLVATLRLRPYRKKKKDTLTARVKGDNNPGGITPGGTNTS